MDPQRAKIEPPGLQMEGLGAKTTLSSSLLSLPVLPVLPILLVLPVTS